MMDFHLIMPMGGRGQRFFENGFELPKPLNIINGKPFFYWAARSVEKFAPRCDITFVVLKEHVERFSIDKAIRGYFPDAGIVVIPEVLKGAVLTCIEGVTAVCDDLPIVFNDCDHMFKSDALSAALSEGLRGLDGALVTFKSELPQFSYVRCDERGRVVETVEKSVISSDAICGAYAFKNKEIFLNNARRYLENCSYSEYFMSGVYNCMAQAGLDSAVFGTDFHVSFGTPEEFFAAEKSEKFEELL
ncbi:MAG: dolichyl-phosphate mannose synthase [Oscillospiraceae bacterium]|nr:dolichyl-phosphate mannose synthase [Oscillospiraceae bacterium]